MVFVSLFRVGGFGRFSFLAEITQLWPEWTRFSDCRARTGYLSS